MPNLKLYRFEIYDARTRGVPVEETEVEIEQPDWIALKG